MAQQGICPKPTLGSLPNELKWAIMSALPNVPSLRSTVLSCPSLYNAFINVQVPITNQVLLNELRYDVVPEAIAALESSRLEPLSQAIPGFVSQHLRTRRPPRLAYTLSDALAISELYSYVHYFAIDFVSNALAKVPITAHLKLDQAPLSENEMARIIRTLYRFEIYCNLFRGLEEAHDDLWELQQQELFFNHFSPWENEQLVCVHNYLFRAVSPSFYDIAEHDVYYGFLAIDHLPFYSAVDDEYVQHILSFGLTRLRQIHLAENYEERHSLLYSESVPSNSQFLEAGLSAANGAPQALYLSEHTQDDELKLPFFQDSDPGPFDAWFWAHEHEEPRYFINHSSRAPLRDWGYVMWDRARLEQWKIFQEDWEVTFLSDEERRAHDARCYEQRESHARRESVWERGGRGWWSPEDESKVVWGEPCYYRRPVVPKPPGPREVESLEEARSYLQQLKLPSGTPGEQNPPDGSSKGSGRRHS